jgi:ABC-2 type transport system ATP-binding protein
VNAVEARNLKKTFRPLLRRRKNEVRAVDCISFDIPAGEIFGLLGPNGAGKTTTVKMLAGLVEPDGGSLKFPASGRRPRLGAVLEGSRNLYWRLSAWENIRYFGEVKGVPLKQLREQADELLALFDLSEKRNRPAQTMSRGMQQKLAVVLALLGDPELLLLDEPTLGLDVASSLIIQRRLRDLCASRGLTIIITTHQMEVAQSLCKRVGIMRAGKIAALAPVAELMEHFRRQDYIARFAAEKLADMESGLTARKADGWQYETLPTEQPGQATLRIKLPEASAVYPLMDIFRGAGVMLDDFRQESPTLEDIFLSITSSDDAVGGGP